MTYRLEERIHENGYKYLVAIEPPIPPVRALGPDDPVPEEALANISVDIAREQAKDTCIQRLQYRVAELETKLGERND